MAKKKVFVSFDYENDKRYYFLMKAWDANSDFEFSFSDYTSKEIKSDIISVIKANLTKKINEATYTLVIIGAEANKEHKDSAEIGYKNWQNFEIAKSKINKNKLVGVKIDSSYESPDEILNSGASWAFSFKQDSIIEALNKA
jgi:hypothetical protein